MWHLRQVSRVIANRLSLAASYGDVNEGLSEGELSRYAALGGRNGWAIYFLSLSTVMSNTYA